MSHFFPRFYRYWGKFSKKDSSSAPYHLLPYHCLDVAACGYIMVKENYRDIQTILSNSGVRTEDAANWIGFLFACHDIGKFARGFQQLVSCSGSPLVKSVPGVIYKARHDSLGYWLWEAIFSAWLNGRVSLFSDVAPEDRKRLGRSLNIWMSISTGHHGMPPDKSSESCILSFTEDDIDAAAEFLTSIDKLFSINKLPEKWLEKRWRKQLAQQSWMLAGFITLADWMGSNEHYFPFNSEPMALADYWSLACTRARYAFSQLPDRSTLSHYEGHQNLFPFIQTLTPLQKRATTLDIEHSAAQLFVFEDVTGAGKTEAAMILTHRLLSAGRGQGVYVGLPTMATANAMYYRLSKAYRALFAENSRPSLILAHGGRQMTAAFSDSVWQPGEAPYSDYAKNDASASGECHAWFADSRKKALLAEVGVGTLDQLLMAVMPFRHQSLRLLGMRDKILILDEVHAYDSYMVRLLEGLLWFHAAQGGSAIILSATLPFSLREKLLTAFGNGARFAPAVPEPDAGYPWLTHLSSTGLQEQSLETRNEVKRCVSVNWLQNSEQAKEVIYQAVETGECICWIRNTVGDALIAFQSLLAEGKIPAENMLLFHSRFAFNDRMAIEEKTLEWFGNKKEAVNNRRGKVLIATQVVEQSLDIDLDNMISDLAPVDLLIQRAGRLQRHIRDRSGQCKFSLPDERHAPVLHVLAPDWQEQAEPGWLGDELRRTGFVYPDHTNLWRTQTLLRQYGKIRMPEDARALIDGVYEAKIPAPPALQTVADDVFGSILSHRTMAKQNLLQRDKGYDRESSDYLWDEERELSTRLGERTVEVYLAWLDKNRELQPVARENDFPWERSRIQVRESWWLKRAGNFSVPEDIALEGLRKQLHRPLAQVVLVSEQGEANYYSRQLGLTG